MTGCRPNGVSLSPRLRMAADPAARAGIDALEMRTLDGREIRFAAAAPEPDLAIAPGALDPAALRRLMTTPFQSLRRRGPGGQAGAACHAMRCVAPGTRIATPKGARPAAALVPGDRVLTRDNGFQPLVWVGRTRQARDAETDPILIAPDALGPGQPAAPLIVSASHRVLLRHAVAREVTGAPEMLVAARSLLGLPGVRRLDPMGAVVDYVHLQCPRHEVIFAEGAPIETLLPGDQTITALLPDLAAWVAERVPELASVLDAVQDGTARPVPDAASLRDALGDGCGD